MRKRVFTRKDIADFVVETFGKVPETVEKVTFEVERIALLTETKAPIWLVEYSIVDMSGKFPSRYHSHILVTQKLNQHVPTGEALAYYLIFLDTITLPEGCTSPQEEDYVVRTRSTGSS